MPSNHDAIKAAVSEYVGQVLSTDEIKVLTNGTVRPGSVLPNDHADRDHRGHCWCAGTEHRLFEKVDRGSYRVLPQQDRGPLVHTEPSHSRPPEPLLPIAVNTLTDEQLDCIVRELTSQNSIKLHPRHRGQVPDAYGLYAIYTNQGVCLHAGRTTSQNSNLQKRIFDQHYAGGGKGAGSDLVQKVQSNCFAPDRRQAQVWIAENCVVRFVVVADPVTRHWAEHRLLSHLRPIWCIPKADLR